MCLAVLYCELQCVCVCAERYTIYPVTIVISVNVLRQFDGISFFSILFAFVFVWSNLDALITVRRLELFNVKPDFRNQMPRNTRWIHLRKIAESFGRFWFTFLFSVCGLFSLSVRTERRWDAMWSDVMRWDEADGWLVSLIWWLSSIDLSILAVLLLLLLLFSLLFSACSKSKINFGHAHWLIKSTHTQSEMEHWKRRCDREKDWRRCVCVCTPSICK